MLWSVILKFTILIFVNKLYTCIGNHYAGSDNITVAA
jgi:hypothetical protein